MRSTRKSGCLNDGFIDEILCDCRTLLEENRFSKEDADAYLERVTDVLGFCREGLGEDAELTYYLYKHHGMIELRLDMHGERLSPLVTETGEIDIGRSVLQELNPLLRSRTVTTSHVYVGGHNIVTVTSPRAEAKTHRSPMLYATILGLVGGLLCLQLPEGIRTFIVNDVAKPIQSVSLGMLTGIMAPVILFSMISAILALGSIDELTNLGFKTIRRFIAITLEVMAVGIGVSLFFYNVIGEGSFDFQFDQVVGLILGIFPTNVLSPLLECNIPQLVVLSVGLGAALLMLGNEATGLKSLIGEAHRWAMTLMDIVMTIVPVVPFISLFISIAKGSGAELLNGWEFIVAIYVSATICGLVKLVMVCLKYKVSARVLLQKLKPMIGTAFASANTIAMLRQEYDISEKELGIKPEFSSFWIPMSQAMLNPRSTLMLVIPPILILKYTNTPISTSFMLALIILVLELSIANPGTTGGWSILFASLAFPADYVGMFITYKLACANYNAAYGALQMGLEQIEAAHKSNAIDLDRLRAEPGGTGMTEEPAPH